MHFRNTRRLFASIAAALACGTAVLCLRHSIPGPLEQLDRVQYDLLLRMRPAPPRLDDRIVLFGIDDRTIRTLGQYPVSRSSHARLTAGLAKAGATLAAWDMIFDLPAPEDEAFAASFDKLPTVLAVGTIPLGTGVSADTNPRRDRVLNRFGVTSIEAGRPEGLPPCAVRLTMNETLLTRAVTVGHAGTSLDPDGVCRRVPVVIDVEGRLLPSLSLAAVMRLLGVDPKDIRFVEPGVLRIGSASLAEPLDIPLDPEGRMLINYSPRWQDVMDRRSYAMQLESLAEFPEDMAEGLAGRAVIIGETQSAGGDFVPTPFEKSVPGMVVVAATMNTILKRDFITAVPGLWVSVLSVAAAVLAGLVFFLLRPLPACLAAAFLTILILAASPVLLYSADCFFPSATLVIAVLLASAVLVSMRLAGEHRRAVRSAGLLARFVSPSILDEMESSGYRAGAIPASRRELSVLFADVAGFTERAGRSEPEEIADFLSAFYESSLAEIHRRGGTLDKVLGDGVLAYFGAPRQLAEKERCAVETALALVEKAGDLSRRLADCGRDELAIRCGIATDYVTRGYFGGERYAAYTVIGRAVNLAARLQQRARPGEVLVDLHTAARIETVFETEAMEPLALKGIRDPVDVRRVTGSRNG